MFAMFFFLLCAFSVTLLGAASPAVKKNHTSSKNKSLFTNLLHSKPFIDDKGFCFTDYLNNSEDLESALTHMLHTAKTRQQILQAAFCGADPNSFYQDKTALFNAVKERKPLSHIVTLLEIGALPTIPGPIAPLKLAQSYTDSYGYHLQRLFNQVHAAYHYLGSDRFINGYEVRATPLMKAAQAGDVEAIHGLIFLGASLDNQNSDGETALMYAIKIPDPHLITSFAVKRINKVLKTLFYYQCNPLLTNKRNETVLSLAQRLSSSELYKEFVIDPLQRYVDSYHESITLSKFIRQLKAVSEQLHYIPLQHVPTTKIMRSKVVFHIPETLHQTARAYLARIMPLLDNFGRKTLSLGKDKIYSLTHASNDLKHIQEIGHACSSVIVEFNNKTLPFSQFIRRRLQNIYIILSSHDYNETSERAL